MAPVWRLTRLHPWAMSFSPARSTDPPPFYADHERVSLMRLFGALLLSVPHSVATLPQALGKTRLGGLGQLT
jgi:hypothetical protein